MRHYNSGNGRTVRLRLQLFEADLYVLCFAGPPRLRSVEHFPNGLETEGNVTVTFQ